MSCLGNKKENAEKAKQWLEKINKDYQTEIKNSIEKSFVWEESPSIIKPTKNSKPKIEILDMNSVDAVFYAKGKTAVLNFASYKNPGGAFCEGNLAQEETLCHASTLYPVLKSFEDSFYKYNRTHLNRSLYSDRLLYSKDILFFKEKEKKKVDVITCAAPNVGAFDQYYAHDDVINQAIINMRFRLIYKVAAYFEVETLIIGAWGCGVFRQNPEDIAREMKKVIEKEPGYFKNIIIAIPAGRNLDAFKRIFARKKQPWEN